MLGWVEHEISFITSGPGWQSMLVFVYCELRTEKSLQKNMTPYRKGEVHFKTVSQTGSSGSFIRLLTQSRVLKEL